MNYRDGAAALGRERQAVLDFCADLAPGEWEMPSAAAGWSVRDVVAHLGGSAKALFTPTVLALMRTDDIERTNDDIVEVRRGWQPEQVRAEFETWSGRVGLLTRSLVRTPAAHVPIPLGELGLFPMAMVLTGALTFDQHTHLRHDIAPALDRPVPATDDARMSAVLAWMLAVLSNQLRSADPSWLDRPLTIGLSGPGGGTWRVGEDGSVVPGEAADAAVRITAAGSGFPSWATCRTSWREHDVRIAGDQGYGARFLDAVNIV